MTMIKGLGAVLAVLWLTGCAATGPAATRYTLPGDAMKAPDRIAGAQAAHRLVVAQPRLARFLEVEGLVLQLDDITLNEASQHQWAEPLGLQLERGLQVGDKTFCGLFCLGRKVFLDVELAQRLRLEVKDPRLEPISITKVQVTRDLSRARRATR